MPRSIARSISRPIRQQLINRPFTAQVLSSFEYACNLVTPHCDVVAVVTPQIGNGPLNIVVEDNGQFLARIPPKTPVRLENYQLFIGDLQIDLTRAPEWNPQPEWDRLRNKYGVILSCLQYLTQLGQNYAPAASLLAELGKPVTDNRLKEAILAAIQIAGEDLQEGWTGNQEKLREAGSKLAGLGFGLTPAGDDFLTGAMLWTWLAHPNPGACCNALLQGAAPRTTTLSAAFLRAAARGECDNWWHTLLVALSEGSHARITAAAQMVLARGATSGADALAGFLYLSPKYS